MKLDWSWAVEGYDFIMKPYGDAHYIPLALADDPRSVQTNTKVVKFFRCFSGSMRRACAVPPCKAELPTNPLDSDLDNLHPKMDASAMVCKHCSRNGERADRDNTDLEVLDLEFEDFSNDKADLNVAQQYFKDQIEDCRALWDARWNAKSDACRALWDAKQLPPNCTTPRGFG